MAELSKTWTELKALVSEKGLQLQYEYMTDSPGNRYWTWATEGDTTYDSHFTAASTDGIDFEANYKAASNKPLFMGEDEVMSALAIRDTDAHISDVSDNRGAVPKTIVIYNDTERLFTLLTSKYYSKHSTYHR